MSNGVIAATIARGTYFELMIDTPRPVEVGEVAALLHGLDRYFERYGPTKRRLVIGSARQGSLIIQLLIVSVGGTVAAAAGLNTLTDFVKNIGSGFKALKSGREPKDDSDRALGAGVRAVLANGGSITFGAHDGVSVTTARIAANELPAFLPTPPPDIISTRDIDGTWFVPIRVKGEFMAIIPEVGPEALPMPRATFLSLKGVPNQRRADVRNAVANAVAGRSKWENLLGQKVQADITVATYRDGTTSFQIRRLGEASRI